MSWPKPRLNVPVESSRSPHLTCGCTTSHFLHPIEHDRDRLRRAFINGHAHQKPLAIAPDVVAILTSSSRPADLKQGSRSARSKRLGSGADVNGHQCALRMKIE